MRNLFGLFVFLGGLLMVIVGFVLGKSGVQVPDSPLGLYSPVTAFFVFGGAVVTFCGFALMMIRGKAQA
jgi:membrane protein DedA with SNARE-associated domain